MKLIDRQIEYSFNISSYKKTRDEKLKSFEYFLSITEEDSPNCIIKQGTYIFIEPLNVELTKEGILSAIAINENIENFEECSIFAESVQELMVGDIICPCSFAVTNIQ